MLMAVNNVPLHSFALKADLWFQQHRLAHCFVVIRRAQRAHFQGRNSRHRPAQDFRDRSGVPSKTNCETPAGHAFYRRKSIAFQRDLMRRCGMRENFPTRAGAARQAIIKGD